MNRKNLLRSAFGILVAALFLYLAFRGTDFGKLWSSLSNVRVGWILLLVPIGLFSHFLRALRWKYLLEPVKRPTSVHVLFSAVMIGYMVNNLIPRVGELIRAYVVGKLEGVPKSSALGTVVIERIIDLATFFFLLCVVLFLYPQSLEVFTGDVSSIRLLFLFGSVATLVLFVVLFLKSESLFKMLKLFRHLVPGKFKAKVDTLVDSFLTGMQVSKLRPRFALITMYSLLIWGFYALALYVPFFAFDSIRSLGLDLGAAMVMLTFSAVAFVLPAPGAFGTYHSFLSLALVRIYGVDSVTALSYSIATHETQYIATMIFGIVYFLKDHLKVSDIQAEQVREELSS
jgi:glycosyltransferase 2 family protein